MSTINRESAFLNRFRSVWARKRRVELGQVGVTMLLLALLSVGLLAFADYRLELALSARLVALVALTGTVLLFAAGSLWRRVRHWSQPTTAAEIEAAFPQLGQSVRTTVQFGTMKVEQVQSEGVATTLVTALAEQTRQHALPLPIEDVVPVKRLAWIGVALVAIAAAFAGAMAVDWEWRNAASRAFLGDDPYRQLEVLPGNQTVSEGGETTIDIALIGRTNREVLLFTRPAEEAEADWTERTLQKKDPEDRSPNSARQRGKSTDPAIALTLTSEALSSTSRPRAEFVAKLDRLTKPVEYRVTAGPLASVIYRIDIRRPLRIDEIKVDLTPPTYTGQPTSTSLDANLSVLEGTHAKFVIQFDKPVKSASLVFAPRRQPVDDEDKNEPEVRPLTLEKSQLSNPPLEAQSRRDSRGSASEGPKLATIELPLTEDRNYSIVAEAEDGMFLAENKYRIRVRQDQPPQVSFESPDEKTEVHTLAELAMRIRVRDDYGLAKAGVIFQVNNEQEVPLIAEDFAIVAVAADELASVGRISPTTQAALEKVLPLEYFELTQKDSVMYFAFAEDNRPDKPQRTETEMRFIDIRPFKRTYSVVDPDPMNGMGGGPGLKSLEELIERQRYGLNRTMQVEKQSAVGRMPDATSLEGLMTFEKELAGNVRDTAENLQSRGIVDVELFFQAEAAMLAAVDSLSVGKWENATLQMRDALKALIEARNLISLFILKNPTPAQLAEMRWLDRLMAQKIRRPKTDKEEARELIRRLEALISDEAAVVSGLESGEETKPEVTETDLSLPQKSVTSDPKSAGSNPASEETKEN
ncbi:MAG: hypothetical protein JWP89_6831 [Schlesneria sp.]|nr:hypothetical protein [Schlesneria sp.]